MKNNPRTDNEMNENIEEPNKITENIEEETKENIEEETKEDREETKENIEDEDIKINVSRGYSIDELINETSKLLEESVILNEPFLKKINLETSKDQMVIYLQTKIDKLTQRIRLVEHKYGEYKKKNDMVSIGIILLSTVLTLTEALKAEVGLEYLTNNSGWNSYFNLMPIVISTGITCSAAIVKFKKWPDKMEGISKTVDKCIFAISRIKKCQEDILFLNEPDEFDEVKTRYHKDIYEYYNTCNQDIEQFLKIEDYGKYLKTLNDIDINIMILEKDKLKKERLIENDFSHYIKSLEKNKENKIKLSLKKRRRCTIM